MKSRDPPNLQMASTVWLQANTFTLLYFQVTLVVKLNKQVEISISEVKSVARRHGAVIKTFIDRSCTHVVCSMFSHLLASFDIT